MSNLLAILKKCAGCCNVCFRRAIPCGAISSLYSDAECGLEECPTHPSCPDIDADPPTEPSITPSDGTAGTGPCACPDLNGDDVVDIAELFAVLGDWGTSGSSSDLNNDGVVDGRDLGLVLGQYGAFECGIDTPQCGVDGSSSLLLVTDSLELSGCRQKLVFSVALTSGDQVVNVYNANEATIDDTIETIPMLGVAVAEHSDLVFDPRFDQFGWAFGLGFGDDAGWYNQSPGNGVGDASMYDAGHVPVFAIERPICSPLALNYEIAVTVRRSNGTIEQAIFDIHIPSLAGSGGQYEVPCLDVDEFGPFWCHVRRVACNASNTGEVFQSTSGGCFVSVDEPPRTWETAVAKEEAIDDCGKCCGVTGACCVNNQCLQRTKEACDGLGGVYLGDGVACEAHACLGPCSADNTPCPTSVLITANYASEWLRRAWNTQNTCKAHCRQTISMECVAIGTLHETDRRYTITKVSGKTVETSVHEPQSPDECSGPDVCSNFNDTHTFPSVASAGGDVQLNCSPSSAALCLDAPLTASHWRGRHGTMFLVNCHGGHYLGEEADITCNPVGTYTPRCVRTGEDIISVGCGVRLNVTHTIRSFTVT